MANRRIDQLNPNLNPLTGSELIPIFDTSSNTTERISINTLGAFIDSTNDTFINAVGFSNSSDLLTLYRNDGTNLSTTINRYNRWHVPSGQTLTIPSNFQSFIYGDFYVEGTLLLNDNSQMIVINGNIIATGGTISGSGTTYLIDLPEYNSFVTNGVYNLTTKSIDFAGNFGFTPFSVDLSSLSTDNFYLTAGTYNSLTKNIDFTGNNIATDFSVNVLDLSNDITVISGVYNNATGIATFTNSTGGTFDVSGFLTGYTNYYTTGATLNGTTIEFDRTDLLNAYSVDLSSLKFTGNTFDNPIVNFYVSNIFGNSPITIQDSIQSTGSTASGTLSFAFGSNNLASGDYSHAEGSNTIASGDYSHAEGRNSISTGLVSHAEGRNSIASGQYSHAEGLNTIASNDNSHSEGYQTVASGNTSHAEGYLTVAGGKYSHAEGYITIASGDTSHAEGYLTVAGGQYSHAEGQNTRSSGQSSHAEGVQTTASGNFSHAEGGLTTASGISSHAEGSSTTANNNSAHAEGINTLASGFGSHAEGFLTIASGQYSHAEGESTTASGLISHAEGSGTTASNTAAHAEGRGTVASGIYSHAGGVGSTSNGSTSFIHSTNSLVSGDRSAVIGGQGITGTSSDTVYVPNLNINTTPSNNDALTQVLVRDTDGTIKYRTASSIGGATDYYVTGGTYSGTTLTLNRQNGSVVITGFTSGGASSSNIILTEPSTNNSFTGEILKAGTGTTVAGYVYYLNSNNGWSLTNSTGLTTSTGLIGVAVGTDPSVDGMLTRGSGRSTLFTGTTGTQLYISSTNGILSEYPPSGVGYVIRLAGYKLSQTNSIIFSPDPTWIEL